MFTVKICRFFEVCGIRRIGQAQDLPLHNFMKPIFFFILAFFVSGAFAQRGEFNIVPQPKSIKRLQGEFELNFKTKIIAADDTGRKSAGVLNDLLMQNYGFKLEYVSGNNLPKKNTIIFEPQKDAVGDRTTEAYGLFIAKQGIRIAGSDAGQFYALQTLMQMLPAEFKGKTKLPAVDINDAPRFAYRGMHLDVGRHFMPVEFVKKYIDLMAQYKFNQFHWHLTEDQGWRIEIKKYPRLTEIGSKRPQSQEGRYTTTFRGDGVPVEGFYTQEQIKDVVAFAKARHINIIPEIELPGHSSAALAAYPNLGCKKDYEYKVQMTWGIFKEVYCPKEETFQFLEDVIGETIALFPDSPYIHIGGDEVLKDFWKDSAEVQELKARENLKDEHEVQSYFIRRIEKFINSKGKKIIGWDEILEGGVAPNAVVMSWRGEKGGIEAAKANHDVIMTPNTFLYFDYGQGDPAFEPLNIGSFISLEKVYSYNPIPKDISADEEKHILGAQANVWTEYLKTPDRVEYMVFPRMLALSEVLWSTVESKNYEDFLRRLPAQFARLDKQKVNYRIPEPVGLRNVLLTDSDTVKVDWKPIAENAKIFYTLDGSTPTPASTEYKKSFEVKLKENEKVQPKLIMVLPNGRQSNVFGATYLRRPLVKSIEPSGKTQGVNFKVFAGRFDSVKELDSAQPVESGETKSLSLNQFLKRETNPLKEDFGLIFDGFINIFDDGIYEFQVDADDGAMLFVDGEAVVDNDGAHTLGTRTGLIPLQKGWHKITLKFFQRGGDIGLNLRYGLKGGGLRTINANELVH